MGNVIKSQTQDIQTVIGNGLSVYVGGTDGLLYLKDVVGNVQLLSDFIPTIPYGNYGLFAQTTDGTPITATTSELSLIDGGVGSLSVPANAFYIGNSFNGTFSGLMSAIGSATLRIRVKTTTGVILCDSGEIDLDTTTNRHWELYIGFTIRNIGTTGVAEIFSNLVFNYIRNSSQNFEGYAETFINNTTFDTTISNTLVITAQWNTNNAGNSIYSSSFVLSKVY
jgi:hypothetical protein